MQPSGFKKLYAVISASLLFSCAHTNKGPLVDVWVSAPKAKGFYGVKASGKDGYLQYSKSENFVAFDPDDAEAIFKHCKLGIDYNSVLKK